MRQIYSIIEAKSFSAILSVLPLLIKAASWFPSSVNLLSQTVGSSIVLTDKRPVWRVQCQFHRTQRLEVG